VPARRQQKRCRKHIEIPQCACKGMGRGKGGRGNFVGRCGIASRGFRGARHVSRESSVHVMHRARMPPNFMVTIVLHGRLKIINPDGQGAGGRMAAELHSSCHWAAPAADPALEVWLFRARPMQHAAESGVHRLHVRAHHAGSGGRWRSGRHHHLLHLFLVLLGNPLSKLFRTW